ncbi:aminotransferase class IV family protein [Mesorhizobium sp. CAU 1732]|uniref:aminotransferase class IV family protein n=1 Tax=Mesorhizobium sp. CAU 1732 TaxID=3140358 RepID=UPI0032601D1F
MSAEGPLRDRRGSGFHLIETMRWEPDVGLIRRDLHLARLRASARELGFACREDDVDATLAPLDGTAGMRRVRLTLQHDGTTSLETWAYTKLAADAVWTVRIADTRLASSDGLLRHKTSRRAVYETARGEFPIHDADEVLLRNERDEICEGTITTIFAVLDDGKLYTPPLSSGLLAGVLRAEMIASGFAEERVLTVSDLTGAEALFVGNSLRGLIPARLASSLQP